MRKRALVAVAVAAVAAVCVVSSRSTWAKWFGPPVGPRLQVAEVVELGDRELYSPVTAVVPILNTGDDTLTLDQFRTDCSCAGVTVRNGVGEAFSPSGPITLAPGARLELSLPFTSNGTPGVVKAVSVRFSTNDPNQLSAGVRFRFTPTSRLFASPAMLALGAIHTGAPRVGEFELQTAGSDELSAEGVQITSSNPADMSVKFLPAEVSSLPVPVGHRRTLGRVQVSISDRVADGSFRASVTVALPNRDHPAVIVPVAAEFTPAVQLSPETVHLPRRSSAGAIYESACILRSPGAAHIQIGQTPPELSVTAPDRLDDSQLVRVTVRYSGAAVVGEPRTFRVPLVVRAGGVEHTLQLSVIVSPEVRADENASR